MNSRLLFVSLLALANTITADQIVPVAWSEEGLSVRLRNTSVRDAASVTLELDGHTAAPPPPLHVQPGEVIVLADIMSSLFGVVGNREGEIRVHGPEQIEVQWRRRSNADWMPGISTLSGPSASGAVTRRRAVCFGCRVEPSTLVKAGDTASFSGSHGVSGTAVILDSRTIHVTGLRHDGSAPGLDLRIGLSTGSRKSFVVLRVTGRQMFQNATLDLTLPDTVDLNSFDTFTVWCYEFDVVIAEGKFRRP